MGRILKNLLLLLVIFPVNDALSQTIKGQVVDILEKRPVASALVSNLNHKQSTVTDSSGNFSIQALPGNLIIIHALSYSNDTVIVGQVDNYKIFLKPILNQLQEVQIRPLQVRPLKIPPSPFHGQSVVPKFYYDGDEIGGVVFRVWYWRKDEKKRQKKLLLEKEYREQSAITATFTEENLSRYLPLKLDDLKRFIKLYTPTPSHFKEFDSNLLLYLNHYYKEFQLHKERPDLQQGAP